MAKKKKEKKQKTSLWQKVKNFFKGMFGFKTSNADAVMAGYQENYGDDNQTNSDTSGVVEQDAQVQKEIAEMEEAAKAKANAATQSETNENQSEASESSTETQSTVTETAEKPVAEKTGEASATTPSEESEEESVEREM